MSDDNQYDWTFREYTRLDRRLGAIETSIKNLEESKVKNLEDEITAIRKEAKAVRKLVKNNSDQIFVKPPRKFDWKAAATIATAIAATVYAITIGG